MGETLGLIAYMGESPVNPFPKRALSNGGARRVWMWVWDIVALVFGGHPERQNPSQEKGTLLFGPGK